MSAQRLILFVHPSDELYGADRCLLALASAAAHQHRALVVLPADMPVSGPLSRALVDAGVDVCRVDYVVLRRAHLRPRVLPRLVWRALAGTFALRRLIRQQGVTLVHTNTLAALGGPLAARIARVPHVWHVHESIADEPPAIRALYRALLRFVPGPLIANAHAPAAALAGGRGALLARIQVVANGVDVARFTPAVRPLDGPLVVMVAGRLAPRKGIAEALEAVAILAQRGIEVQLRLVGDPPPGQDWRRAAYVVRARELGIAARVRIEPFVPDIAPLLAASDILLLASQRPESSPLVVLEGMAAGLAVIATRNGGGSDEQLRDGITGLYCERSPAAIAGAIERLASDAALRARLGAAAREAVELDYPLAAFVGGVLGVHHAAVRSAARRRPHPGTRAPS